MSDDEYEDIPMSLDNASEEADEGDTGEAMTDDKLGLALKKAINSNNGAAICEFVRKILDAG